MSRYLPRLTKLVERRITRLLPDCLALVFDGWTSGATHYVDSFPLFRLRLHCQLDNRLGCWNFLHWVTSAI